MDKKLKTRWVKALRGGNYKQGKRALHVGDKFCCLGVLADIQHCKWKENKPFIKGKKAGSTAFLFPKFAGGLPRTIQSYLALMNDDGGFYKACSFKQIANYIEKEI